MRFKPYPGDWELIGDTAKRLMSLGSDAHEARINICRALNDGRFRILVQIDSEDPDVPNYECRSSVGEVERPQGLTPQHFDWRNSRPKTAWLTGNGRLGFMPKRRRIQKLKLHREDVNYVFEIPEAVLEAAESSHADTAREQLPTLRTKLTRPPRVRGRPPGDAERQGAEIKAVINIAMREFDPPNTNFSNMAKKLLDFPEVQRTRFRSKSALTKILRGVYPPMLALNIKSPYQK